jgi:hypothetical protein
VARSSPVSGPAKLSSAKQARPGGRSVVARETGGTGASVRMYFRLPPAIRPRSFSVRRSGSGMTAGDAPSHGISPSCRSAWLR